VLSGPQFVDLAVTTWAGLCHRQLGAGAVLPDPATFEQSEGFAACGQVNRFAQQAPLNAGHVSDILPPSSSRTYEQHNRFVTALLLPEQLKACIQRLAR
jgi:hypothetical protein